MTGGAGENGNGNGNGGRSLREDPFPDARVLLGRYQLAAKKMRPDLRVAVAAYGDYGPAYIGTTAAYSEGGYETGPRASNVAPEVEPILTDVMKRLLGTKD